MGIPGSFAREKLVVAVLTSRMERTGELLADLAASFGALDFTSPDSAFDFTDYYTREMGKGIWRFFASFRELVEPDALASIKIAANGLENRYREDGLRKVNLDPGLLCLSRFVLATTKENSHRIPLRSGIYGEVTLIFEKGTFRPVEWTYPDYRSESYIAILNAIRGLYRAQLTPERAPR